MRERCDVGTRSKKLARSYVPEAALHRDAVLGQEVLELPAPWSRLTQLLRSIFCLIKMFGGSLQAKCYNARASLQACLRAIQRPSDLPLPPATIHCASDALIPHGPNAVLQVLCTARR